MATITSSTTQNLSATGFVTGDRIDITAGQLTIDTADVGDSRPERPTTAPTASATGGGSSGGLLPAGTYRASYANVDSGGKISVVSAETATFTVSAGNIPRITLPSKPSHISSRNVYLTDTSQPTGARKLYLTGNTTTSADLAAATWNNDTQSFSAAPAEPTSYAITIANGASLRIKGALTIRGDVLQGNGNTILDGSAGDLVAGIEWNSASAGSTSSAYAWFMGTASTQADCKIITENTDASHRVFIRSNSGGANGYFRANYVVAAGTLTRTTQWNVKFINFVRLGDSVRDAITIYSTTTDTYVQVFEDFDFDAGSGALAADASNPIGAGAGYSVLRGFFNQTAPRNIVSGVPTPFSMSCVATTPTVTNSQRMAQGCYFLKKPALKQQNYFDNCTFWEGLSNVTGLADPLGVSNSLIRSTVNSPENIFCNVTGNYFIKVPPFTLKTSGTVTGGSNGTTDGTLTNSGASWGTTQYAYGTSQTAHAVRKTTSGGATEIRLIQSHTATTLTVAPKWDTAPVAGDTYEIVQDIYNPHFVSPGTTAGVTYRSQDCVYENGGTDPNGDGWYTFGGAANYYATGNVVVPNVSGKDTSCCLITSFSNTPSGARVQTDHNTCCIGRQAAFQICEGGTAQPAGTYEYCRSNIGWAPLSAASYTGGLNGYLISSSTDPTTVTQDIIDPTHILKNWLFQGQDTGGLGGNGVNTKLSTAPEAIFGTTDPQFVAPTRNLATWGAANGADGTMAGALALLAADPTLIPTMRDWVRDGFAPQNASLEDAGHDGVTIGAVEGNFGMAAGTLSEDAHDYDSVDLSWTSATGNTGTVTEQLERSPNGAGTWASVSGVTTSPATDSTVSASTAYDYRVAYTDDNETVYSNTVTVTTDAAPAPDLSVTVQGGAAVSDAGTDALGTLAQGSSQTRSWTITNDGDATATLGTITVGTGLTITADPSGQTIAPAGTKTLTVSVDTSAVASISAAVSIPSDDADSPYNWTVTAEVTDQTAPTISMRIVGDQIRVTASETVTGDLSQLALTASGGALTIDSGGTFSGTLAVGTLNRTPASDETVTATLTEPSGIEDAATNAVEGFTDRAVGIASGVNVYGRRARLLKA